jgi:hypothetical protein
VSVVVAPSGGHVAPLSAAVPLSPVAVVAGGGVDTIASLECVAIEVPPALHVADRLLLKMLRAARCWQPALGLQNRILTTRKVLDFSVEVLSPNSADVHGGLFRHEGAGSDLKFLPGGFDHPGAAYIGLSPSGERTRCTVDILFLGEFDSDTGDVPLAALLLERLDPVVEGQPLVASLVGGAQSAAGSLPHGADQRAL